MTGALSRWRRRRRRTIMSLSHRPGCGSAPPLDQVPGPRYQVPWTTALVHGRTRPVMSPVARHRPLSCFDRQAPGERVGPLWCTDIPSGVSGGNVRSVWRARSYLVVLRDCVSHLCVTKCHICVLAFRYKMKTNKFTDPSRRHY